MENNERCGGHIVASCAYRQIVAVAACHGVPKRLPLYSQLAGSDIHHIDVLGTVDWIWRKDGEKTKNKS